MEFSRSWAGNSIPDKSSLAFQPSEPNAVGYATSPDVLTWTKSPVNPVFSANPIIFPGKDKWDHDATYKPYAIFDGQKWLLWYNGRHAALEQIGVVLHEGEDLGF